MSTDPIPEVRETAPRTIQVPALLRFLLAAVLVVIVNMSLPRLCYELLGDHLTLADTLYRWSGSLILIGGFLFLSRVVDQVDDETWSYIGLPRRLSAIRESAMGLLWGGVLVTLAVVPIAISGASVHFSVSTRSAVRLIITTVLLVGGALLEELMFRGYPFQRLMEGIGATGAIVVLSIFFGAVHLNNPNAGGIWSWGFFNTLAVGVLFALAYLRTRALWFPIGIHLGWNFFLGVVYGLPVSGIKDFAVIVHTNAHGPKLLTGGAYGIEASLTGFVVIVLGTVALSWAPKPLLGTTTRSAEAAPSI